MPCCKENRLRDTLEEVECPPQCDITWLHWHFVCTKCGKNHVIYYGG